MTKSSLRGFWLALAVASILALPALWLLLSDSHDDARHAPSLGGRGGPAPAAQTRRTDPKHHPRSTADCRSCHPTAPHREGRLNSHGKAIACQTCHLPRAPAADAQGHLLAPTSAAPATGDPGTDTREPAQLAYFWFNPEHGDDAQTPAARQGDAIALPRGDITDPGSQIWPFVLRPGTRSDSPQGEPRRQHRRLVQGFVDSAQALSCMDCHGRNSRLNWAALGYAGNPMRHGGRKL